MSSAEPAGAPAVFVYGSLMFERVWQGVAGKPWAVAARARARGWRRHALLALDYPGLRPHPEASTDGLCVFDVDARALARLDAFEGAPYERVSVKVELLEPGPEGLPAGARILAQAYCFRDASLCMDLDWDPARFASESLEGFVTRHGLR